jgi:hypothetical protein
VIARRPTYAADEPGTSPAGGRDAQPDRRGDDEARRNQPPGGRAPITWLLVLNFLLLQWLGLRLARVTDNVTGTRVGWTVLRWTWPLTGWWSPYRWIVRSGPRLRLNEVLCRLAAAEIELARLRRAKEPVLDQDGLDALVRLSRQQYHDRRVAYVNQLAAGTPPSGVLPPGARPLPPREESVTLTELRMAMLRAADVARAGHTSEDAVAIAGEELGLVLR